MAAAAITIHGAAVLLQPTTAKRSQGATGCQVLWRAGVYQCNGAKVVALQSTHPAFCQQHVQALLREHAAFVVWQQWPILTMSCLWRQGAWRCSHSTNNPADVAMPCQRCGIPCAGGLAARPRHSWQVGVVEDSKEGASDSCALHRQVRHAKSLTVDLKPCSGMCGIGAFSLRRWPSHCCAPPACVAPPSASSGAPCRSDPWRQPLPTSVNQANRASPMIPQDVVRDTTASLVIL